MIVRKDIDLNAPLNRKQKKMLTDASEKPIIYDEDAPELSTKQLKEFKRISDINRSERRKQTVTIRISSKALKKARSLGKGYTSVLSRILENALNDNDLIKRYL